MLNTLLKNKSILLCIVAIVVILFFGIYNSVPNIKNIISVSKDIGAANQELLRYEEMQRELNEKQRSNKNKNVKLPVKVFKSEYPGAPVESASVDFVNEIITLIEETGNDIITIAYETNKITEAEKKLLPNQIQVVILKMNLDATYDTLKKFMEAYYTYENLASIYSLDIIPLPEDKSRLNVDIVLWLYVES